MEHRCITIKGRKYELTYHQDNSAPCSKCAFWDMWNVKCRFPKNRKRGCVINQGTSKGWNTYEYQEIPNEQVCTKMNKKDMTQEEKQLLLKDLSERLPYTPILNIKGINGYDRKLVSLQRLRTQDEFQVCVSSDDEEEYLPHSYSLDEVKPYLRSIDGWDIQCGRWDDLGKVTSNLTYLLENYYDINGLIPIGLAHEAPEGMYNVATNL